LEANTTLKTSSGTKNNDPDVCTVLNWIGIHEHRIHYDDTDLLAFLSCLFPERRPDRIYWLQHASLAKIIARSLLLGVTRKAELDQWQMSGFEDLGQCVENVMRQAENPIAAHQAVTLEEIDGVLNQIAARCRFSGRRIRRQRSAVDIENILGSLYRRVSSREAKWLTRMILKSYYPLVLPSNCILKQVHFLLPALLHFQDSLEAATTLLIETPLKLFPPKPAPDVQQMLKERALDYLTPQVGTKVGRPDFCKARSIKHCCKMIGQRRMSLERKYDGEYCQIHINLTDASQPITIFSKSGRDSTMDRYALHSVLNNCLRIGESSCKFHQYCIVEGEMVVWSDKDEKILDFHKLRKFVPRSGKFLGADFDSQ
jgi:DNA ligase 4